MKFKKSFLLVCSVLTFSCLLIGAADPSKGMSSKSPVIIGEVIEVEKDDNDGTTRITVEGYIKGNEVNKIKVIGIVNDETKVMNSANDKKENITIEKGDLVYMRISEAMTKSLPPQTVVKRLFITKNK